MLEQVGLAEQHDKPVGALSGGMKQRLALALALLNDPPVLVLDEPTSNLDTLARSQLLSLASEVKAAGKTILFTSHRVEEVEMLADSVLVMAKGELQFDVCGQRIGAQNGLAHADQIATGGRNARSGAEHFACRGLQRSAQRRRRDRRCAARRKGTTDPLAEQEQHSCDGF